MEGLDVVRRRDLTRSPLALGHRLRQVLPQAERSDACDEIVRNRLAEGNPEIPFLTGVGSDGFLDVGVAADGWIEAEVILESAKVTRMPPCLNAGIP